MVAETEDLEDCKSPAKEEKWQIDMCQAAARDFFVCFFFCCCFFNLFPAECGAGQLPNQTLALEFAV